MLNGKKSYKVLALITKKDGGTHWMRVGSAYQNKDDSINAYVDAFPREGKLQIRELDEDDLRAIESKRSSTPAPPRGASGPQLTTDSAPF